MAMSLTINLRRIAVDCTAAQHHAQVLAAFEPPALLVVNRCTRG
jgi:hypothetical protein